MDGKKGGNMKLLCYHPLAVTACFRAVPISVLNMLRTSVASTLSNVLVLYAREYTWVFFGSRCALSKFTQVSINNSHYNYCLIRFLPSAQSFDFLHFQYTIGVEMYY